MVWLVMRPGPLRWHHESPHRITPTLATLLAGCNRQRRTHELSKGGLAGNIWEARVPSTYQNVRVGQIASASELR